MKFKNVVTCDLRKYNSVEAASEIESVTNAALVIFAAGSRRCNPRGVCENRNAQCCRNHLC